MKSKRTWLAGILSIVMTMTFMPTQAFAAEETENATENNDFSDSEEFPTEDGAFDEEE